MKFIELLKSIFSSKQVFEERSFGVIPDDEDYRDIDLPSVQKPLGGVLQKDKPIPAKLLELETLDQDKQPACVTHAIGELLMYYIYKKFGVKLGISPRFAYKLCKLFDSLPTLPGTKPRIGALVFSKFGCCTEEFLKNDTSLSPEEYLKFEFNMDMFNNAHSNRLPGFAYVPIDLNSVMDALIQNDVIAGSTLVGNWNILPTKPGDKWHYTLWCGFAPDPSGDTRIYYKNQWGKGWLAWIKSWLFPGYGYFLWNEYIKVGGIADIIAFTDIPQEYLNIVKNMPYKFTYKLTKGMNDPAVKELQKLLNSSADTAVALEGQGSPGQETTFFGPATQAALINWQKKNNIDPIGIFGPMSMAKANERIPKITLEQAIILQESGGDDNAIGDKNLAHHAYGCMQIRQPAVDDVNKKLGTNYKAQDCLGNRALSIKIFDTYVSIYAPYGTDEERSRLWNAGPGWRLNRSSTDAYWASIKKKLNQ